MNCPDCGRETLGGRCNHCGAQFIKEEASMSEAARELKRAWAEDQSRTNAIRAVSSEESRQKQNWAPVLSVLLPGLGQTYLGNKWGPIISLFYLVMVYWALISIDGGGYAWFPAIAAAVTWFVSVYRAFPRD